MSNPNRDRLPQFLDGLSSPINPSYNEYQLSHRWQADFSAGRTNPVQDQGKTQGVGLRESRGPENCNKEDFLYLSITNNLTPAAWAADGTGKDQPMSIPVLANFAFSTTEYDYQVVDLSRAKGRSPPVIGWRSEGELTACMPFPVVL